jgi:hypothetical protein
VPTFLRPAVRIRLHRIVLGRLADSREWTGNPGSTPAKSRPVETGQEFTIQVQVEEERIDAIVADRKRHQSIDLTEDDFEVHHDGDPKNVFPGTYIAIGQGHEVYK